jgi:methylmalonyl-CoA mutase C-terminal domain/subunit
MIEQNEKKKILLGKLGLDAHDNGIVIVSKWLSDAGFEIVYLGFYNFPEQLIDAALQEDVDAIGVSFLGGEHLYYTRKLIALMKEKDIGDVKLIIGGVIPPDDVAELKEIGVAEIFTPGAQRDTIIEKVRDLLKKG